MIKHLEYFHGTGHRSGLDRPKDLRVAVSVGSSQVTEGILRSFKSERISELAGKYGDRTVGDPVEVDRLEIQTTEKSISVTVFNRGLALLFTDNDEMRRLHRFFGVVEHELASAS